MPGTGNIGLKSSGLRRLALAAMPLLIISAFGSPAQASSPKPSATIALTATGVEVGQSVTVTYQVRHASRGANVMLQQAVGTAGVWRNVRKLRGSSGTTTSGALAMGKAPLRVVVLGAHRRILAKSGVVNAYAYGPVSLYTLRNGGADSTVVIGGQLFRYETAADNGYQGAGADHTTCRSITVSAGIPDNETATGGTLTVIEERSAGGSLTVPPHVVVSTTIPLAPGAFEFGVTVSGDAGIYWNATLDCWSPTGS